MNRPIFTGIFILIFLVSCPQPLRSFSPTMSVEKQQIRVGESITLTVSLPSSELESKNPNITNTASVYIYSSNTFGVPYVPLEGDGFSPESDPIFYPVDPAVELTTPVSPNNVPPRIPAIFESGFGKGVFIIKGKNVGIATIRAGFLLNSVQFPNQFITVPFGPSLNGKIVIEVIP
jgi:hypothetical protein